MTLHAATAMAQPAHRYRNVHTYVHTEFVSYLGCSVLVPWLSCGFSVAMLFRGCGYSVAVLCTRRLSRCC